MNDAAVDFSVLFRYFSDTENLKIFSTEQKHALETERKTINLVKGDYILEEGHAPNGVYLINSGIAKLFKVGFTGKEQIIRFLKKGDLIGYRSILSGESFRSNVQALDDMEIEFIPERFFVKMLEENPRMSYEMLKIISRQLGRAEETITVLAQKTVRERLAEILLMLEEQLGTDANGFIKIALTREEMANLIGTATESAIRLISEFKNDNLIAVEGRKIKIENRNMITKLAHV